MILRRALKRIASWLMMTVVVLGCGRDPSTSAGELRIVDDLGFNIGVKPNIRRVVSLVPTNSEMVCLLDCRRLVGGTRYDEFPHELRERVRLKQIDLIGGGFDANLEKIVQLRPDLILTNGPSQQRFAMPLKRMGYSVVSLWPRDWDGLIKDFLLLGELLGQQPKAQNLVNDLRRRFQSISDRTGQERRKRVYLQMWSEPLITVGGASFTDWLVSAAGGANIFNDLPFDSPQVSLESIIQRDPEVLVFLADQASFVKALKHRSGWSAIRGVRDGRFCFVDEPDIRRSIMFVDGLAKLQSCLHGSVTSPKEARP